MKVDREKVSRLYKEFVELNGRGPTLLESKEMLKSFFHKELEGYTDADIEDIYRIAVFSVLSKEKLGGENEL